MRRYLAFILAVLTLTLTCIPCSDVDASAIAIGTAVLKAADTHHHCGDTDAHTCSPLCACSCCAGVTVPARLSFQLFTPPLYSVRHLSAWTSTVLPDVHLPIWQPPKLG
ncbi:MAG: hypothetical protein EOP52_13270 [Sphingobacteriales bacterium]|nr:MAG: hypothetical protein EOP52_13270 [Sphingobacteriales bacterium]